MKDFAAGPGRLRTLSLGAKLVYSAFAISAVIGMLVSWRLYGMIVADAGPGAYYAGDASSAPVATSKPATRDDGPEIELAPDAAPKSHVIVEQISDRKLLEVTHFHLFSVPVYVLILAHLWLLARVPPWAHVAGVALSIVTSALHVAGPWLVRGRSGLAWLMPVSGVAMLIVLGGIAAVSLVDMWLPPKRRPGNANLSDESV